MRNLRAKAALLLLIALHNSTHKLKNRSITEPHRAEELNKAIQKNRDLMAYWANYIQKLLGEGEFTLMGYCVTLEHVEGNTYSIKVVENGKR